MWCGQEAFAPGDEFAPVSRELLEDQAGFADLVWLEAEGDAFAYALLDVGQPSGVQRGCRFL